MRTLISPRALVTGSRLSLALCVVIALATVVVAAARSSVADPITTSDLAPAVYEVTIYLCIAALGTIVTVRQPANVVGWLLQLIALPLALTALGNHVYAFGLAREGPLPGFASYAAWSLSWLWIFAVVPAFVVFPMLFPSGRPASRHGGRLLWLAAVGTAALWFGTAFAPGPIPAYEAVVNPLGLETPAVEWLAWAGAVVIVPCALAALCSMVLRFRRSVGVERQQLKWVAAAATMLPVAASGLNVGDERIERALLQSGFLLVAVAIAIAMVRHRLYDIDVVISRTLVYATLTVTLAASYLVSVLLLHLALRPLTESSDLAVAGSTLAVAALFGPLRRRIQGVVDRRFFRRRYDATRTVAAFTTELRDEVDLDTLKRNLRTVVLETVQPAQVSLWLRKG